jgi:hypothetical protein
MKLKWILLMITTVLLAWGTPPPAHSNWDGLPHQVLVRAGKSYKGIEDSEYISYDLALRDYVVKQISERFSVALDPKTYSGFDLLEIESLFNCKKRDEPFEIFLKMFPKHPQR